MKSPAPQKLRKVGKVKEAHSLRGELSILIFSKDISWLKQLEFFSLQSEGTSTLQEFEIEKAKPFKNGLLLKAKGIDDRTAAEKLKGLLFLIPEHLLQAEKG